MSWNQNQSNYNDQSQQTKTTERTNENSKKVHVTGAKRGKTRVIKSPLVLHLIGWVVARFLNQSQSVVKQSTLNWKPLYLYVFYSDMSIPEDIDEQLSLSSFHSGSAKVCWFPCRFRNRLFYFTWYSATLSLYLLHSWMIFSPQIGQCHRPVLEISTLQRIFWTFEKHLLTTCTIYFMTWLSVCLMFYTSFTFT